MEQLPEELNEMKFHTWLFMIDMQAMTRGQELLRQENNHLKDSDEPDHGICENIVEKGMQVVATGVIISPYPLLPLSSHGVLCGSPP